MTNTPKKVNYAKMSLIITALIGAPGAIATLVTFPEIGCKIGLNTPSCNVPHKDVELVAQTETGELLPGVTVEVIANKGAPEVSYTDTHGYVTVNIPSKGEVRVILIKQGYPTQDFNINLENSPDTIRTIKFSQSGQPSVQPVTSLPPSPNPSASLSSIPKPVNLTGVWDLKFTANKQVSKDGFINDFNGFAEYVVKFDSIDSRLTGNVLGARGSVGNICSNETINGNIDGKKVNYTMQNSSSCCPNETSIFKGVLNSQGVLQGTIEPAKLPTSNCSMWYGTVIATKRDSNLP